MQEIHKLKRFILKNISEITDLKIIHQIITVLRLKENNEIIGLYENKHFLLKLKEISKNLIKLETIKELEENNELNFYLKVYIPLLKNDKTEFILQKCTELGVKEFQPVLFERNIKQNINYTRWQKIIEEAVEQSERSFIPIISQAIHCQDIKIQQDETAIILLERIHPRLTPSPERGTQFFVSPLSGGWGSEISIISGPEGGFTEKEKEILLKNFKPMSLGSRVLRAETAMIAGVSILGFYLS